MTKKLDSQRLRGVVLALAAAAGLVSSGCSSLRIHHPQDLTNARQAQAQFQAAELAQTVAAERDRMKKVLAQELELVRDNTLARRDARLLYVIGEGDTAEAWAFLEGDIAKRLEELGIEDTATLEALLSRTARAEKRKEFLDTSANEWNALRSGNPDLPLLECPQGSSAEQPAEGSLERTFFDDYRIACDKYLEDLAVNVRGGVSLFQPLANEDVIEAMEDAKVGAENATQEAEKVLAAAMSQPSPSGSSTEDHLTVRQSVKDAVDRLLSLGAQLESLNQKGVTVDSALGGLGVGDLAGKVDQAKTSLDALGLGAVVGDLSSIPELAVLEASREQLVAGLSATLDGETASKVLASLQAIGVGLEAPAEMPLTAMVLMVKQLGLDIEEARKKEAFFDKTLALLKEQEQAYRDELAYLGQAELLRQELEDEGCLSVATGQDSKFLEELFADQDVKVVRCRERVFRLLVNYSASWALGRVESERIDYRLIALHHESALDTSEIAFRKWESLLGLPIDQLVALYETGLKPEDILSFFQVLGIGAVAVGVN